jgi:hypothetical protein
MAIKLLASNNQHVEIIKKGLNMFQQSSFNVALKTSESARAEELSTSLPHPVFFVTLADFIENDFLRKARRVGLRYLLLDGNEPYAAATLRVTGPRRSPKFYGLTHGDGIGRMVEAVGFAETMPETKETNYELRVLEIPEISFKGLWLYTGADFDDDFIIPMRTMRGDDSSGFSSIRQADLHHLLLASARRARDFIETGCPPNDPAQAC